MACSCGRFLLFILNFVVLAFGVTLVALASIVIHTTSQYGELMMDGIMTLPIWTIVVGLFISMIGFFGCWGALRENRCMLYLYATIVFVLFAAQLALGIMILVKRNDVEDAVKTAMTDGFEKYNGDDESYQNSINLMEQELKCCGVNNYTDWFDILNKPNEVTKGCCLPDTDEATCYKNISDKPDQAAKTIYTAGCFDQFISWIKDITIGLGVVAIILALIQLACVFYACGLAKSAGETTKYY